MNTKYRYKPLAIDAVQFQPTPEGIAAIALFGGADFTGVNLSGRPLPAAFVADLVIPEGSWLVRNASGMYKVLKDSVFTAVCERAPVEDIRPAAAVVAQSVAEAAQDDAPPIVTLEYARANGLIRYFNAKPCVHGHTAERYTRSSACVVCAKELNVRVAVREKRRAAQRVYNQRHREKKAFQAARQAATGIFAPLAASLAYNMGA